MQQMPFKTQEKIEVRTKRKYLAFGELFMRQTWRFG